MWTVSVLQGSSRQEKFDYTYNQQFQKLIIALKVAVYNSDAQLFNLVGR